MIHELKTWPEYFEEVFMGRKKFELRNNDRNYQVGDYLRLREWEPNGHFYTGMETIKKITYVLTNANDFGLQDGFCLISFE